MRFQVHIVQFTSTGKSKLLGHLQKDDLPVSPSIKLRITQDLMDSTLEWAHQVQL